MRIAIFSDVHGNLTALEAVLADIAEQEDIETIFFAGDLCLFGPRPEACLDLLKEAEDDISSIYGNTDRWIDGPPLLSQNIEEEERRRWQHVHDISSWTRERLPAMDRAWLRELPFHRRVSPLPNPEYDLFIVHANPLDASQIIFPPEDMQKELYGDVRQSDEDLGPLLGDLDTGILAFGHLHVPFIRTWGDKVMVDVGSVSIPGDGDPRAKYAIFSWEKDEWDVEHRYVAYDVEPEIAAYRANQPPGWEEAVAQLEDEGMIPQVV